MRLIYILPDETLKSGGNWVTATRLSKGLRKRSIEVDIAEVREVTKESLEKYDVIHVFHVFKSLKKISSWLMDMDKKVVVSFTGTDLKELKEMKMEKEAVVNILNKSKKIIVFHKEAGEEVIQQGILPEKIKVIPQTPMPMVNLNRGHSSGTWISNEDITFLFVGGIREVKGPLEVVEMMSDIVEEVENVKLILVGPCIDNDLVDQLRKKIKNKKWAVYLGEVSHEEVQELISRSDIVVNSSFSEGMPNALLESQQLGKPILARNIAGNRSIVTHGLNGYLFKSKEEFKYYGIKLAQNSRLRKRMGSASIDAMENYDWIQEIAAYESVYRL